MTVTERRAEYERIINKYPDRIPVFCDRAPNSDLPEIEKKKFLVPGSMLFGEFKYVIHKHVHQAMNCDQTIYLFADKSSPKSGATMMEVHRSYKSDDNFLYLLYSAENTLGACEGTGTYKCD
jgi:GABA(A) receptor-associated protein